jgi:peptide-methionine (S)-S-oxide reductase
MKTGTAAMVWSVRSLCKARSWAAAGALAALALAACPGTAQEQPAQPGPTPDAPATEVAIFAGGCFWCMEPPFEALAGVLDVISGYTGGQVANPTYGQVSSGTTGHAEAIQITFDPQRVSYSALLDVFWKNIDPVAKNGQFCDQGSQYRSAIFALGAQQKELAERSRAHWVDSGRFPEPITTEVADASAFYPAEEYHQDYHKKSSLQYKYYRYRCGRDQRLEEIWGAPDGGAPGGETAPEH